MQDLLIFPFNGNGIEALDCLNDEFNFIGFVDDTEEKQGMSKNGYIIFNRNALSKFPNAKILAVPGSPTSFSIRHQIIASLQITQDRFATIIHPSAKIGKNVTIGRNCLIYAGVVLTSNTEIGNHVCILPNTVVHHDTKVGDYTLIGSNVCVAGNTEVGNNCYIGSGTNIINNIKIGNNTLIGLGSNIIKSVEDNLKVIGNPARAI